MTRRATDMFRLSAIVAGLALAFAMSTAVPAGQGRGGGGRGGIGGPAGPGARGQGRGAARDVTSAVGTGAISGRIVIEGTGSPVRRARLVLSGAELRGARSTLSDDQGLFAFDLLPAGRFTLTASKPGYVDATYGARRAGRPGTPIQLAEGQKLDRLAMTMPRGSVITGTVVDESGDPSPGTLVRAMRVVMRTGTKSLQPAGQDQTDDRGMYRIYQLQPGDYIVSAVPRNQNVGDVRDLLAARAAELQAAAATARGAAVMTEIGINPQDVATLASSPAAARLIGGLQQAQNQDPAAAPPAPPAVYAPVYYPGTTAPSGAATLAIGIGEERTNVDFHLQLVPTARVEGIVATPDGSPRPPATQLALVPADRAAVPGLGVNMTRADASGHFVFRDVTPGQYSLQARAPLLREGTNATGRGPGRGGRGGQIGQVLWAATDVFVNGQDVVGLGLSLQRGLTVSGRLEFRGTSQPPDDLSRVRVTLTARGEQTFEIGPSPAGEVSESGQFTVTGVAPGRYTFTATLAGGGRGGGRNGAPGNGARGRQGAAAGTAAGAGWTLASALVNGQDALDFPIDIGAGGDVTGATLTFTDRTQELSGTIQDANGQPASDFTIIVFPSDQRFWLPQSRRIGSVRPGTDGRFVVRGLPPGDYRMTAVTDVEPGEWYDPAFLTQLQGASIPIALTDGEKKIQDVKLAGG